MQLSPGQLKDFDEQGYLFFPNCFNEEEIAQLRDDAEAILKLDRKEVWREKSGAPRTAFAAHTFNETFRLMAHHPRLIEPLRQLFGEDVYVHQFKLNAKAAFEGDVWQWHQDYGTWARDDGMPEPRAMNIAIFLDEVMPINGALMLIPKSHKQGVLAAGHDTTTTSYPLWTLDKETVTRLAANGGIVAPTGKPGSVLMFHGNLVHASPPNITPYPRKIVYLTLCACSNHITKFTRAEWIAHRDFAPIVPVADDALLAYARAHTSGGGVSREPAIPPRRARRRRQAGPRRADRRRQIRLDVPGAGAVDRRPRSRSDRRSRSGARQGGMPQRRLGCGAHRAHAFRRARPRRHRDERVEVVIEATGSPTAGIAHALEAIEAGKHIVMVNVEADTLAGAFLARKARAADVIYSLAYGDQPALIAEMVDWARAAGFRSGGRRQGHKISAGLSHGHA